MTASIPRESHSRILFSIIVVLLALRILFLAGLRFLNWPDYEDNMWLWQSYTIPTYFLTGLFIFLERPRLDRYHLSTASVALFISLPIIQPILLKLMANSPRIGATFAPERWPQVLIGLSLAAALLVPRSTRTVTGRDSLAWLVVSLVCGIAFGLLSWALIEVETHGTFRLSGLFLSPTVLVPHLAYNTVFQASSASIDEEPLFRGLMWGYLRDRGWKDSQAFLLQGLLFWAAHFYRALHQPFRWWVLIPLASILFGWLAWKSRSITGSMLTHALSNALPGAAPLLRLY